MTNHVSGKLSMSPGTHILTEDGKSIAQLNYGYDLPVQEANGRRLVACWNACQGIDTEDLERLSSQDQTHKLITGAHILAMEKLAAQRDQLLAALSNIATTLHDYHNGDAGYMSGVAKDAIAACEVQS